MEEFLSQLGLTRYRVVYPCVKQTDGQTDRIITASDRLSPLSGYGILTDVEVAGLPGLKPVMFIHSVEARACFSLPLLFASDSCFPYSVYLH